MKSTSTHLFHGRGSLTGITVPPKFPKDGPFDFRFRPVPRIPEPHGPDHAPGFFLHHSVGSISAKVPVPEIACHPAPSLPIRERRRGRVTDAFLVAKHPTKRLPVGVNKHAKPKSGSLYGLGNQECHHVIRFHSFINFSKGLQSRSLSSTA